MIPQKSLILDANILIRAVFGSNVRRILKTFEESAVFYCPDLCIEEAYRHISLIAERKGKALPTALSTLNDVILLIAPINREFYQPLKSSADARIASRDPDDWPIVATALFLNFAIWTEDLDFFGCGLPTWTTDRVELYLQS